MTVTEKGSLSDERANDGPRVESKHCFDSMDSCLVVKRLCHFTESSENSSESGGRSGPLQRHKPLRELQLTRCTSRPCCGDPARGHRGIRQPYGHGRRGQGADTETDDRDARTFWARNVWARQCDDGIRTGRDAGIALHPAGDGLPIRRDQLHFHRGGARPRAIVLKRGDNFDAAVRRGNFRRGDDQPVMRNVQRVDDDQPDIAI